MLASGAVAGMAEACFGVIRAKPDGGSPDADDLQACFEDAWDREAADAAFGADEDVDLLKRQAAMLTRKYLDNEVAPEIEPTTLQLPGTRRYRRRCRAGLRGFAGYQRACDRPEDGRAEAYGRQW